MNKQIDNYVLTPLSPLEASSISGGGFWEDFGYGVGYTFGLVTNAFEKAVDLVF